MNPSDVQDLFLDQLGLRIGDEMTDYLVRRFTEGGAAAAPVVHLSTADRELDPIARYAELADMLGHGTAVPAAVAEPDVH